MNDPLDMLTAYFHLMNANGASHVYRESIRTGVLAALEAGPKTAEEVARQCSIQVRPTELLLQALAALDLVEQRGAAYHLTLVALLLLSGSYRNLGDEYWAHLPTLLKTDQPLVRMDDASQSEAHYQSQAAILGWMLTPAAKCAAGILAADLPPEAAILDLGAGSAVWSLTVASQTPAATVTAVDWPAVLEVAAEKAQELGVADRLVSLPGDFHKVALPANNFDLAILANVSHLLTPEGNAALLDKTRAALCPQGRVAVIDVFPGQPQGDLNRTLYAIGLSLRTAHGHVYSLSELRPLLTDAGFDEPELIALPVPPFAVGMLLARVSLP